MRDQGGGSVCAVRPRISDVGAVGDGAGVEDAEKEDKEAARRVRCRGRR